MPTENKELQKQIDQLYRELNEIRSSKFFKIWQKYCNLREKILKPKPKTYDYYHKNTFWNDHPLVCEYMNSLATDNKSVDWMNFLYNHYFKKKNNISMLSVGCGNGWQDRDLNKIFNFATVDGYDISLELLAEAKKNSPSSKFHYYPADLNNDILPKNKYDLAINLAALHHVENMDHIVKTVYDSLKPGGIFAHFDYIGPKRNQYSDHDLKLMNSMQKKFPQELVGRNPIVRPSLEVMLREDPSEAVGSEAIIPTLKKYFKIKRLRFLNGGLLYQVLYNQIQNFDVKNSTHNKLLLKNIAYEKKLTVQNKVKPLFAFIICVKN